jgi:GNAT superfamily N-acetyltransferase
MEIRELFEGETHRAAAAMLELRPDFETVEAITAQMDAQRATGYRLAASFGAADDDAAAVAGFRIMDALANGRHVVVDDLVTRRDLRGQGHGEAVLAWVRDEARRHDCGRLHLDSAVHRFGAHRFYFRERLVIVAHHFAQEL